MLVQPCSHMQRCLPPHCLRCTAAAAQQVLLQPQAAIVARGVVGITLCRRQSEPAQGSQQQQQHQQQPQSGWPAEHAARLADRQQSSSPGPSPAGAAGPVQALGSRLAGACNLSRLYTWRCHAAMHLWHCCKLALLSAAFSFTSPECGSLPPARCVMVLQGSAA